MLLDAGMVADADGTLQWEGEPLKLTLVTSTRSVNTAMATVLESQFRSVGIILDIQQMEVAAAMEAANAGEHDLFLWRYTWNDPDALSMWFRTDRIGNGNRAFYSNERVDSLLARGKIEIDQSARQALYVSAQEQILSDAAWQPLVVPIGKVAVRDSIQDLRVVALGRLLFNDVTVVTE
jgi:peptide/nickel transport system substrate-binding protein